MAASRSPCPVFVPWTGQGAEINPLPNVCISTGLRSTRQERAAALATRKVIAQAEDSAALIEAAPETQPYRDKPAIGRLLEGLSIRIEDWQTSGSCHLVRVSRQGA